MELIIALGARDHGPRMCGCGRIGRHFVRCEHRLRISFSVRLELSKKTRRSTHDLNQARTKPWLTRPTTSDNLPIMEWIKTNEMPKINVSLTLAIVADCTRKQRDGAVGTKALSI